MVCATLCNYVRVFGFWGSVDHMSRGAAAASSGQRGWLQYGYATSGYCCYKVLRSPDRTWPGVIVLRETCAPETNDDDNRISSAILFQVVRNCIRFNCYCTTVVTLLFRQIFVSALWRWTVFRLTVVIITHWWHGGFETDPSNRPILDALTYGPRVWSGFSYLLYYTPTL